MNKKIKILIVDDFDMVLQGIAFGLRTFPDVEIIGMVSDLATARESVDRGGFNMMLVDLHLSDVNNMDDGIEIIKRAHGKYSECKIIAISYSAEEHKFRRAIQAGAFTYIVKNISLAELGNSLRLIHKGYRPPLPPAFEKVMQQMIRGDIDDQPPYSLTKREFKVLWLMSRGMIDNDIASQVSLSRRQINRENCSIFNKLGVDNRTQATAKALNEKLFELYLID